MKILVTGGSGFIGNSVVRHLVFKGYNVRAFDLVTNNLRDIEHYSGSILDPNALDIAMKGCDVVIHLAAMLGVKRTELKRLSCINVNVQGFQNVLDAGVKRRIRKVLLASSSEVYGDIQQRPIVENDVYQPKSIYATTKILDEELLRAYAENYSFDYNIIRFFNVYGRGQVAEFVLPRFIKAVQDKVQPSVYGTGEQTRTFCYMDDAAEGVRLILEKADSGEVFNIGSDKEIISMKDLAELVIKISGEDLRPRFVGLEKVSRGGGREVFHRSPNIDKARNLLKYDPKISLEEGIKKVFEFGKIPVTWWNPLNNAK